VLDAGHTAYSGPTQKCLSHLERLERPCPPLTNPAEFIVEAVSERGAPPDGVGESVGGVGPGAVTLAFASSPAAEALRDEIRLHLSVVSAMGPPEDDAGQVRPVPGATRRPRATRLRPDAVPCGQIEVWATTFSEQFGTLFRRAWLNSRRSPIANHAAMGRSLTMGLLHASSDAMLRAPEFPSAL